MPPEPQPPYAPESPYGPQPPYAPESPYGQGPTQPHRSPRPQRGPRPQGPPHGFGAPASPPRHAPSSDHQVWPPARREPVGGATQPIPAIRPTAGTASGTARFGAPQPPGAQPPGAQPPGAHPAGAQSPGTQPSGTQPSADPEQPATPSPNGSASPTTPRSRRRRTALIAAGAIVASLLVTAGQTYDGYLFYEKSSESRKDTQETIVPAGQAGKVHNTEYRATVATTEAPEGSKPRPGATWMKVEITKKVLDEAHATMTAGPTEVQLRDAAGRTWVVETQPVGDAPIDKVVVGKEYRIQGLAIVPAPVANEVQLSFRPSAYRSDTPTGDLFDRKAMEKAEKDDVVLVFRRR
ncbi:hypothetical protein [Nonomuraea gerenzanensis]|uniref:Uncharacterized protein n=1 Tax=Nonomuraea gerenzanensis TaxID=93944 RepID=A0A1M4DZ78_9ACTN|nr:hypothetical protein [Nonomuraea gerenzanensis]UBU19169.1 hypothetical protein LCN96_03855 [Nonomuraea gerenzanensis]SBO91871.1 hypothetical protein BN4615_P1385 [Nonomuraea gerenzanensis]